MNVEAIHSVPVMNERSEGNETLYCHGVKNCVIHKFFHCILFKEHVIIENSFEINLCITLIMLSLDGCTFSGIFHNNIIVLGYARR